MIEFVHLEFSHTMRGVTYDSINPSIRCHLRALPRTHHSIISGEGWSATSWRFGSNKTS